MGSDPAVHGHGIFHGHIRLFIYYILKENAVYGIALGFEAVCVHLYPGITQSLKTFSCHHSIRIIGTTVDLSDLVLYDRVHTWRLLAKMAARLKRHIHDCALGICLILKTGKCCALSVELSISHMISLSYDPAILHYDSTYKRIWIHCSSAAPCKLYGTSHI